MYVWIIVPLLIKFILLLVVYLMYLFSPTFNIYLSPALHIFSMFLFSYLEYLQSLGYFLIYFSFFLWVINFCWLFPPPTFKQFFYLRLYVLNLIPLFFLFMFKLCVFFHKLCSFFFFSFIACMSFSSSVLFFTVVLYFPCICNWSFFLRHPLGLILGRVSAARWEEKRRRYSIHSLTRWRQNEGVKKQFG